MEGFEDFGELGRAEKLATQGVVFYLRGLYYSWKIPFCYFTSASSVKAETLVELIKMVLSKIIKIGLCPKVLVADQGSNNRLAFKKLGATEKAPYFIVSGHRIISLFDTPHLLKSLRNNLMNHKLEIFVSGNKVSWSDFTETYALDKASNVARSMLRISDKHINPTNFQKMRVKYAAQIFSNSVSAAILTAKQTKQLNSPTALNTATFFRKINDIFDSLNSKCLSDPNPFRRGLSVKHHLPKKTLQEGLELFSDIRVMDKSKERNNIYCLEGFRWTITGVLQLWEDAVAEGMLYLFTSRLNQDPLENFFSVVRSRGGYNPYPKVKGLRIGIQQNMHIRLQATAGANCECDNDEPLPLVDDTSVSQSQVEPVVDEVEEADLRTSPTAEFISDGVTVNQTNPTVEECTITYVAGYLAHFVLKKTKCDECRKCFILDNDVVMQPNEILVFNKNYDIRGNMCLKRPTLKFSVLVNELLKKFGDLFQKYKLEKGLVKNIKHDLISIVLVHDQFWFDQCSDHRKIIIDQLVKIKLYRAIKWIYSSNNKIKNTELGKPSEKPHRKIRILS